MSSSAAFIEVNPFLIWPTYNSNQFPDLIPKDIILLLLLTIENKSINALIRDMIEERYEKLKKQKRLDNFYTGIGLSTGLIGETSIQKIKANKSV